MSEDDSLFKTNYFGMKILNFRLKNYFRIIWTSKNSRDFWEPVFKRINICIEEIEWKSIAFGLRECSLKKIKNSEISIFQEQVNKYGLLIEPFGQNNNEISWIIIGKKDSINDLKISHSNNDYRTFDKLLGAPECCSDFCNFVFKKESLFDIIWPSAFNSVSKKLSDTQNIEIEPDKKVNIILNSLGIKPVFHLPCSFDCQSSILLSEKIYSLFEKFGYYEELELLEQILDWPAEWSSLHGISEIKTPVMKISVNTDATTEKYTVRFNGKTYPENGTDGIVFPYRKPKKLFISDSKSYKEGLDII